MEMLDALRTVVFRKCTIILKSYNFLHDMILSVYRSGFATAANLAIINFNYIDLKFNVSNFLPPTYSFLFFIYVMVCTLLVDLKHFVKIGLSTMCFRYTSNWWYTTLNWYCGRDVPPYSAQSSFYFCLTISDSNYIYIYIYISI